MDQTRAHLDLLGIFHYVSAGLSLLCGGLYAVVFVAMAGAMKSLADRAPRGADQIPPEFLWMFGGIGVLMLAIAAGTALMAGVAGWCLRARKAWIYCVIVAALSLLSAPIGTVLGIFTLIVLMRPEAKALFGGPGTGMPVRE